MPGLQSIAIQHPPGSSRRLPWRLALATLALGLGLTVLGVSWVQSDLDQQAQARFERHAQRIQDELQRRFSLPLYGLTGLQGLYASTPKVSRAAFRSFVEARDFSRDFPGVRGFAFVERVQAEDLQRFVATERADGAPEFAVKQAAKDGPLFIVKYVEPMMRNRAAWGIDLGAEPVRREAIDRAIRTGRPALSGRIGLMHADGKKGVAFLFLLPLFHQEAQAVAAQGDMPPVRSLRGLLSAPIQVSEVCAGIPEVADLQVGFELFDGDTLDASNLLYDSEGDAVGESSAPARATPAPAMFQSLRRIEVGGRDLSLRISTTAAFDRSLDRTPATLLALTGTLLSALLALAAWLLSSGRERAEALAANMTADLDRLAKVVQHTSSSVAILDAERYIVWVNEGFERLFGYTLAEAKGQRPSDLSHSELLDTAQVLRMRQQLDAGRSFRGEMMKHDKSGRLVWTDSEVQPLYDSNGVLTGFMSIETDISPQKVANARLEAALRDTDVLLRTINAHAIVSVTDQRGRIIEVNQAFVDISGFSREELLGQDHRVTNSGQHGKAFWSALWHTIASGHSWRGEICNRSKDGRLYWVDSIIAPFMNAQGRIEKFVSIRNDITLSKTAEQLRQQTLQRFVLAADSAGIGVWDYDLEHNQISWDDWMYRLYGRSRGGDSEPFDYWLSSLHPEDRDRAEAELALALSGEREFDTEFRVLWPTGEVRHLRASARVLRDAAGAAVRMIGINFDITRRKRAELELRQTSTLLSSVLDSASEVAVIGTDMMLGITVFNIGAERMLGYAAEEVVGKHTPDLFLLADEIRARGRELSALHGRDIKGIQAFVDPAVLGQETELTYVAKTGQLTQVAVTVTVMHDSEGHAIGYLGVAHDVTRQKIYQNSLKEAMLKAEQANLAKSQFLANMSHELRTPMNAILGMLQLLQKTSLTSRQWDYTRKTEVAARSLLGLLNDILDFSKVEAGKMSLTPRVFRTEVLWRELSVILSGNLGSKNVELVFDIDPELPPALVGDDMRLQQVLINLGGNAIKFTEQGAVVLSVRVVERDGDRVRLHLAVRDSGIGISEKDQAHIFEAFAQGEASTTRRFGGTGLGLSICQRLVTMMGGELQLQSEPGMGSTFHFDLSFEVAVDPVDDAAPAEVNSPLRVLIVDDHALALEALGEMARSLKWHTDLAQSGAQALEMLRAKLGTPDAYQLVFIDWHMPGMDGWQTCQHIGDLVSGPERPLLLMITAHGSDMLAEQAVAQQTPVQGILFKPITASMMVDAVADAQIAGQPRQLQDLRPQSNLPSVAGKRLEGLRLLVVEDNPNNRQVAQELLSDEGAEVMVATNGQEGVEAIHAATGPHGELLFDAVLMDVQMPVLDGFDATAQIRRRWDAATLPVIAMTANALPADRKACLDAGMNDHVGKPFDLDQLVDSLLRLTGRGAASAPGGLTPARPDKDPHADTAQAPDVEAADPAAPAPGISFDLEGALARMGGNARIYLRVLESFHQNLAHLPDQMQALLAPSLDAQPGPAGEAAVPPQRPEAWHQASELMHALKGIASTLGLNGLTQVAAWAERTLRQVDSDPVVEQILAAVRAEVHQAQVEVNAALPGLQARAAPATPAAAPADLGSA